MTLESRFHKEDRRIRRAIRREQFWANYRSAILAGGLGLIIGFSSGVSAKTLWDYAQSQKAIAAEVAGQEYRAEHDLDAKRRVEKMKFRTRVR